LTNWAEGYAGTSKVYKESSIVQHGSASLRLGVDYSNNMVEVSQDVSLSGSTQYRLDFYARVSSTTSSPTLGYLIINMGNNKYLQADGSWSTTPYVFSVTPTASWQLFSRTFTTDTAASYRIDFRRNTNCASKSLYVDNASVVNNFVLLVI
jgi:hypothetical protein